MARLEVAQGGVLIGYEVPPGHGEPGTQFSQSLPRFRVVHVPDQLRKF